MIVDLVADNFSMILIAFSLFMFWIGISAALADVPEVTDV